MYQQLRNYVGLLALSILSISCQQQGNEGSASNENISEWPQAVSYEIFVQSFYDSSGDGIGDINGMTEKLDYLQDLGIGAIWLMPISPSPTYHKYDVTDYIGIHPDYGTMDDFKNFINEAHDRDIKVVIDLVINHTARVHPWFQESMKGPDNPYRDYYVWAKEQDIKDDIEKKATALDSDNIEQWHEAEGNEELYYGYFWGGMPDLNFDNPKVKEEIFEIGRFWLEEVGVDGFRLDAARHIFPDDRPEDNHQFWVEFREAMQDINPDVHLVGEVWADAATVAPYLAGLQSLFNFDLGYAITEAVQEGRDNGLADSLQAIHTYYTNVNENFVDGTFITNHDQNRIMSEVGNDENKAKAAASLLLTLPGAPYIYYGEEIGMRGMKPDENIREPFLWDEANQAEGQTSWMEAEYSTYGNVQPLSAQKEDESTIFHHYKNLIHFRNSSKPLTFGQLANMPSGNETLMTYWRFHEQDSLLVVHNLSSQDQSFKAESKLENLVFSTHDENTLEDETIYLKPMSTSILSK